MLRDVELEPVTARGSHHQLGGVSTSQLIRPIPLPPDVAVKLSRCALHCPNDNVAVAKPMPAELRNQVGDILSTSAAITVTGPLISAYLCEANTHAELRIDNFFETPEERRHIGPAKLVVASTGPLTIRIESTEVGSPMQMDLDVALGDAALVFGELVPYRIMAAHPYIIVHAFF